MTTKSNKTQVTITEVLEPTEIITPTAEQYIEKAVAEIQKVSQTEIAIEELKKKYGTLSFTSVDDRPNYFAIVEGEKITKSLRLAIDKKRTELNEFPLKYQRAVNAEAKRITAEIEPIEDRLKAERKKFEDAEAAEKAKEDARKRGLLIEAGFRFDGTMYTCGVHIIQASAIYGMEEGKIEFYCQEARAIREQEKKADERRAREKEEAEETLRKIEEARAALAKEKAELDAKKKEVEPTPEPVEQPVRVWGNNPFVVTRQDVARTVDTIEQVLNDDLAPLWDDEPKVKSPAVSKEYVDGFEHCRVAVLALFADEVKRTRAEFSELIKALKP